MPNLVAPKTRALGFTELEVDYVTQLLITGSPKEAQELSGISLANAKILSCRENYSQLIRQMAGKVFIEVLAPKAIARLQEYAEKGAQPDRGQLDAVKTILDRVGFIAPKASDPVNHDIDVESMNESQLREFIFQAEQELAALVAPNAQLISDQVIDVLD